MTVGDWRGMSMCTLPVGEADRGWDRVSDTLTLSSWEGIDGVDNSDDLDWTEDTSLTLLRVDRLLSIEQIVLSLISLFHTLAGTCNTNGRPSPKMYFPSEFGVFWTIGVAPWYLTTSGEEVERNLDSYSAESITSISILCLSLVALEVGFG